MKAINYKSENPAVESLKTFGGMIKDNVLDPTAKAMNYANPVTFAKNAWDAAGRLPETMAKYDQDYAKRVKEDLYGTTVNGEVANQGSTPPEPTQSTQSTNELTPPSPPKQRIPPPSMESNQMPQVNIQKNNYATGQPFNKNKLNQQQRDQSVYDNASPYRKHPIEYSGYQDNYFKPMDKSKLRTESGELAYDANGKQTGVPLFDNAYAMQRYGKQVYNPPTRESIAAARQQQLINSIPRDDLYKYYQNKDINQLAQKRLELDTRKYESPNPTQQDIKPHYQKTYSDDGLFNETGEMYDGYFDPHQKQFIKPEQPKADVTPHDMAKLRRGYKLAQREGSDESMTEYMDLLKAFGLTFDDLGILEPQS